MIHLSPTFRLSLTTSLVAASLVLVADLFGLVPDTRLADLEVRKRSCESLAVQLSIAASRSDLGLVKETLDAFVARNPDVLSAAMRRATGDIFSQTPDHAQHWVPPAEDHSTFTHVLVPVFAGETRWGSVEVSFSPSSSYQSRYGWLRASVWGLAVFTGVSGLCIFYLVLRRALRELDPRGTIPQRIKSAFDALGEGVLILDHRGFIVLANSTFAKKSGRSADSLIGLDTSRLEWRDAACAKLETLPWNRTVTVESVPARMLLRLVGTDDFETQIFATNCAPILDDQKRPRGVIVTFDDVTALEKKNEELKSTIELLQVSEREIKHKNEQLSHLAARDPLTGCLNRRAFFDAFQPLWRKVQTDSMVLSCLMADIDHFKSINDRFGHDVGDTVIKWVVETIQSQVKNEGLVCRYGGEEFCVVLPGLGLFQAHGVAQQIRRAIEDGAPVRFGSALSVTISVGLSSVEFGANTPAGLITQADQALYVAKSGGRNRVVRWTADTAGQTEPHPTVRRQTRASEGGNVTMSASDPSQRLSGIPEDDAHLAGNGPVAASTERAQFAQCIEEALRERGSNSRKSTTAVENVAVLSLVPNQFRRISDTFGPAIGAELLTAICGRLHETLRSFDMSIPRDGACQSLVSHLGVDELGIVLAGVTSKDGVDQVVSGIFRALSQPLEIRGHVVEIGVSIGVALTPEGGNTPDELLKNATAARHYAQERNRNERCEFYSDEMTVISIRRTRIVGELQHALDNDQFELNFQPQQDLQTGQIVAWEALLRWSHPQLGIVLPSELIPIAEQTGLIHSLGRWVLRASCLQAKAWSDAGLGTPRVAVNLSAVQLQQSDIVTQVRDVLAETGLQPDRLELEITESAIMEDQLLAQRTLRQLKEIGIRIAIDDFGIGYSGLSYIKNFPMDVVKVDRSFLSNVSADLRASKLYGAIVDMALRLSLYVVAEGVEAQEDLDFVRRAGCNAIQGYLLSTPIPAAQVERMLRDGIARKGFGTALVAFRTQA